MAQNDSAANREKIVLGDTHFTYPGENDPIPHSAKAIANDQRHLETMRLTGLEMIRRASPAPD